MQITLRWSRDATTPTDHADIYYFSDVDRSRRGAKPSLSLSLSLCLSASIREKQKAVTCDMRLSENITIYEQRRVISKTRHMYVPTENHCASRALVALEAYTFLKYQLRLRSSKEIIRKGFIHVSK